MGRKTVRRAHGGVRKLRVCFGACQFKMPLNIQIEMVSRQPNMSLKFRAEAGGDRNLGVVHDRWCVKP